MRSPQFSEPRLSVVKAGALPLSGPALAEIMRAILARDLPLRFRARGWSMVPFIQDGDLITVAPLHRRPPGIGEVVAFIRPGAGNLVVHRVVGRRGAAVLIQGDSITTCPDGIIPPENLLGRVIRIERNGHPVWLGLGLERLVIAWLSRARLFIPLRLRMAARRRRFS